MKVLMKKDLRKVGKKGELVEVSDGYGANYLIPNGYAVLFTEKAKKDYEKELELEKIADEKRREEALLLAEKLKNITLEFEAYAGRRGEMIGTISFKEIIEALKKKENIIIEKKMIVDKDMIINGFGNTKVKVELYKGVFGFINIHVSLKEKK